MFSNVSRQTRIMFFPPEIVFPARLVSLLLVRIMGALGAALCYREKIAIFLIDFFSFTVHLLGAFEQAVTILMNHFCYVSLPL